MPPQSHEEKEENSPSTNRERKVAHRQVWARVGELTTELEGE